MSTSPLFLLSPAYCGGRRTAALLREGSDVSFAVRLRQGELSLGEAFAFISGLYFRGKLAYAQRFGPNLHGADDRTLIITPTRGLLQPETTVTPAMIREFATVDIAAGDERYKTPLGRDLARLPDHAHVVLLGSIATGKYVDLLAGALGRRLLYPPSFIGRGDMSRGGLLLRSASAGVELEYAVLDPTATRHGPRPPKLPPAPRISHTA